MTVADLVTMVRIVIDDVPVTWCLGGDADSDGKITIDEIVSAVGDALNECGPPSMELDLSTFTEFQFVRHSGLGFCPPLDAVFSASISVEGPGVYRLDMSVLEAGRQGVDDCLQGHIGPGCVVARPLPSRFLTPVEVERMQQSFASVEVFSAPEPVCEHVVFDPCLINIASWDDFSVDDQHCSGQRVDQEQAAAILELLDSLRPSRPSRSDGPCVISGCSGQVCAERSFFTTCEFLPEYICYRTARCARQPSGACDWTPTPSLLECLAQSRSGGL